ncbi:hypothetical protein [Baaleninema simplex]|uniref:hypothetical protein n=1 Tax=Baaleninema simplex TaxID=2862350 RepID=UPI00130EA53C|nr:hypothetical protein [Baaleninema simplex]
MQSNVKAIAILVLCAAISGAIAGCGRRRAYVLSVASIESKTPNCWNSNAAKWN